MPRKPAPPRLADLALSLRDFALTYPDTHEDFPWDERVVKVGKKVFVFLGGAEGTLGMSVKLPISRDEALSFPFAEPTGYGLGKHGWVSVRLTPDDTIPPLDLLQEWIDESFRAVAPKRLVAQLPEPGEAQPR